MASQHISASLLMTALILLALSTGMSDKLDNQMNYTAAMRSKELEGKIISGYFPELENVKYQVSVRLKDRDKTAFGFGLICGGSLIKPHVVISAAVCFTGSMEDTKNVPFRNASEFMVAMGNLDRFDSKNTHYTDLIKILMPTKSFDFTDKKDIALLFLKNPVPSYLKHIQPIELNNQPLPDGTMCTACGWGLNEHLIETFVLQGARNLLCVDVPFISQETCMRDSEYKSRIVPGLICAGYMEEFGKDTCFGDHGGPLVCNGLLTGIVSDASCGIWYLPGIYTDVLYHKKWIEDNVVAQKDPKDELSLNNSPPRSNYRVMYLFALLCHFTRYF